MDNQKRINLFFRPTSSGHQQQDRQQQPSTSAQSSSSDVAGSTLGADSDVSDRSESDSELAEDHEHSVKPGPAAAKVPRRAFENRWLQEFQWLEHHNSDDTVSCTTCSSAKKKNAFAGRKVRPTAGWKKQHLQQHAASRDHTDASRATALAEAFTRSRRTAVSRAASSIAGLMKTVLFTVQAEFSTHKAEDIHALLSSQLEAAGVTPDVSVGHRSNFSTNSFIEAMATSCRSQHDSELKDASCFTLQIDESTDLAHSKNLLIYAQYVSPSSMAQKQVFLKLKDVEVGTAEAISGAIIEELGSRGIDVSKMVMFTSDGASVMLGRQNGVFRRLQRAADSSGYSVEFHCVAHREALAMKDTFALSDYFSKFEQHVKDLIAYLSTHKHSTRMKSVAEAIDAELVSVGRIHEVRWLSRSHVVNGIARNLPVIQAYLKDLEGSSAIARTLYSLVTAPAFVYGLGHLADILNTAAQLNRFFQRSFLHPSEIGPKLKAVSESLNASYVLPNCPINGPMVTKLGDMVDNGELQLKPPSDGNDNNDPIATLNTELHFMVSALLGCLEARLNTSSPLLDAARAFDFSCVSEGELATFGNGSIKVLAQAYEKFGISDEGAESEWNVFKYEVAGSSARTKLSTVETLQKCVSERHDYANLAKIAEILLCFNSSNALVERGFSLYNRLKNKLRNRLKPDEMDRRMQLCLNAVGYKDFDYDSTYTVWLGLTERGRYKVGQPCASAR